MRTPIVGQQRPHWLRRLSVGMSAMLIVTSLLASSAGASATRSPTSLAAQRNEARAHAVSLFVRTLRPYLSRGRDGTFTLAPPVSVAHRVRADWLAAVQRRIASFDRQIPQGKL